MRERKGGPDPRSKLIKSKISSCEEQRSTYVLLQTRTRTVWPSLWAMLVVIALGHSHNPALGARCATDSAQSCNSWYWDVSCISFDAVRGPSVH